jgi:hypothetical protein
MPKRKTRKARKGAGMTQSRPRVESHPLSKLPPLPPSPTNKPELSINNEGLMPPQKGSEERQKRVNATLKARRIALGRSIWSNLFGQKYNNYKPNRNRSYFPISNSGFKPPKPES